MQSIEISGLNYNPELIEGYIRDIRELMGEDAAERLFEMGYFEAPAAAHHHGALEGGLIEHSYAVAEVLTRLTLQMDLEWSRKSSPVIVGLLHDICKIKNYTWDFSDPENPVITYDNKNLYPGHGECSLQMANELLQGGIGLNPDEALCIRYHMGAFTDSKEWQFYSRAVEENENVMWTHMADMYAAHILNK